MQNRHGSYRVLYAGPEYLKLLQKGLENSASIDHATGVTHGEGPPDQPLSGIIGPEEIYRQPVSELKHTNVKRHAVE